jgi:hypothetical protein
MPALFAKQRIKKSGATQKKFPGNTAEWEALIAAAPGEDRPLTSSEETAMSGAVVVQGGGYAAVKSVLAEKRPSTDVQMPPGIAPQRP